MAQRLGEHPGGLVTEVFSCPAERQGAYDFLENKEVAWSDMAAAAHEACARRCQAMPYVIAVADGSSYTLLDRDKSRGTGPIGSRQQGSRGLKVMTLAVLSPSGRVLGVGGHAIWSRPEVPDARPAAVRSSEEKETKYWNQMCVEFERALSVQRVKTKVWYQFDAGGDMVDTLWRASRSEHELTVRLKTDRTVLAQSLVDPSHPQVKVCEVLASSKVVGYRTVRIGRNRKTGRRARNVRLEVRAASVSVRLFRQYTHARVGDVTLNVVRAREVGTCPADEEPVEWILWTTHTIATTSDVMAVVSAYALRWRVERLFYATKSGACEAEQTHLRSFGALSKWLVLETSVAARLLDVMYRSRTEPQTPAREEFTDEEVMAAKRLHDRENPRRARSTDAEATLGEMMEWIARLGGYVGKSSGGPPGIRVLERGWQKVVVAAAIIKALRAPEEPPTSPYD